MSETVRFNAELKQNVGKGHSRMLRTAGKIPAIIYGDNAPCQMVVIMQKEFLKEYLKGGIKSKFIELDVNGSLIGVIPKDVQIHPVTDMPIHIDFLKVGQNTLINVAVSIRVINEDKSPGIKKGGIANIVSRNVIFNCHPSNIPHHIDIDLSDLEIGHNVHIQDVKLPQGIQPVDKTNFTLVSIIGRAADEEKATTTEASPNT